MLPPGDQRTLCPLDHERFRPSTVFMSQNGKSTRGAHQDTGHSYPAAMLTVRPIPTADPAKLHLRRAQSVPASPYNRTSRRRTRTRLKPARADIPSTGPFTHRSRTTDQMSGADGNRLG